MYIKMERKQGWKMLRKRMFFIDMKLFTRHLFVPEHILIPDVPQSIELTHP